MAISIKYIVVAVLLVVAELIYFRIAAHFNIVDKPNERSSHTHVILRGGGIIFVVAAWLWSAFFGCEYPWFLIGLTLIATVSFIDDVHSLSDSIRLIMQFIAMFMMFYELGILHWRIWWVVMIAWIVCVGIMNAFNFMDGINGITGGYSLSVLIPLILVDIGCGDSHLLEGSAVPFTDINLLVVIALATLIFCFFNFRKKAKCFAGDVGAVSLAFIFVFAIALLIISTGDFSYIMFLAVYGVDTVLTIIHRIMLHENLGQAHRKHAYQIMANELYIPHLVVSSFYMILQLVISCGLIWLPMNHYLYSVIILAILATAYVLFMKKYYHLHEEYLASLK